MKALLMLCTYLLFEISKNSSNYLTNLMKRMAPASNPYLPKSTLYFIKRPHLVKSAGIELEDDGQVIKLHPDLNNTQVDLFQEFPLLLTFRDIHLELYLNSSSSSSWGSHGTSKLCVGTTCADINIDDSSQFYGTFKQVSFKPTLGNISEYLGKVSQLFDMKHASISGTLTDLLNSTMVIEGMLSWNTHNTCQGTISIARRYNDHPSVKDSQTPKSSKEQDFNSTLEVGISCFNTIPSEIIKNCVSDRLPQFSSLDKIAKNSKSLINKGSSMKIRYKFVTFCTSTDNSISCKVNDPKKLVPVVYISIWFKNDSINESPSVTLKVTPDTITTTSKNYSVISTDFIENASVLTNRIELKNILDKFKLTKSRKIVTNPDLGIFDIYFLGQDIDLMQSCLPLGEFDMCNWNGILHLAKEHKSLHKCTELELQGDGLISGRNEKVGDISLLIQPECIYSKKPIYRMLTKLSPQFISDLFKSVSFKFSSNKELASTFNLSTLSNFSDIFSTKETSNFDEFLLGNKTTSIYGLVAVSTLKDYVKFAINVKTTNYVTTLSDQICFYLSDSATTSMFSKITFIPPYKLPGFSKGSSACIKPMKDETLHDLKLTVPINLLKKCAQTEILCQFLQMIYTKVPANIDFTGSINNETLKLYSKVVPDGSIFKNLNLSECFVFYKLETDRVKVKLRCKLFMQELNEHITIQFRPRHLEGDIKIYATINDTSLRDKFLFNITQFSIYSIKSNFELTSNLKNIPLDIETYFSTSDIDMGIETSQAAANINLKNSKNSTVQVILPPYSIFELLNLLGFGECSYLKNMFSDTLKEWNITLQGLPLNSRESTIYVEGVVLVSNILFNSIIEIEKPSKYSKLILKGVKPIVINTFGMVTQVKFTSYSNLSIGPLIIFDIGCACENLCQSEIIGNMVSNVEFLGIRGALKMSISEVGPWEGSLVSHTFLGQSLKVSANIMMYSLEGPIETYGYILGLEKETVYRVQMKVVTSAQHIIRHANTIQNKLNAILELLNKIRSKKKELKLKLKKFKENLDEETIGAIVYETSMNLTCQEEECSRVCLGCPTAYNCMFKDILGSCVTITGWDRNCRCGREPICVMFNDACEKLLQASKRNLKIYETNRNKQQLLYESTAKEMEEVSKDEAKSELLFSSASKLANKVFEKQRTRLSEAKKLLNGSRISDWLVIEEIKFSIPLNMTEYKANHLNKLDRVYTDMICIYVKISYTDNKRDNKSKELPYCPSLHGNIADYVVEALSNFLYPTIVIETADENTFASDDITEESTSSTPDEPNTDQIDVNPFILDIATKSLRNRKEDAEFIREKRANKLIPSQISQKKKGFIVPSGSKRMIPLKLNTFKNISNDSLAGDNATSTNIEHNKTHYDEGQWMLPSTNKGRCRVLYNVVDILNDLLKTVSRIGKNYYYSKNMMEKQNEGIILNKEAYEKQLKNAGIQLHLNTSPVNDSFHQIVEVFNNDTEYYVNQWKEELELLNEQLMTDWQKSMSDRIKNMGGKGFDKFLKNLQEVISILVDPAEKNKRDSSSLNGAKQVTISDPEKALYLMNRIKSALSEGKQSISEVYDKLSPFWDSASNLKKTLRRRCL